MRDLTMKRNGIHSWAKSACSILAVLFLAASFGGCAKFQSSRKMDIGPFGENAMSLMGDVQSVMTMKRPFFTKPYMYGQNIEAYRKQWSDLQKVLRGIVMYSTQVVSIANAKISDKQRAEEMALIVNQMLTPVVEHKSTVVIKITREELDKVLADIRAKTNLLDMLGAAQPMVDTVVNYTDASFESLKDYLDGTVRDVIGRMDDRWGDLRDNVIALKDVQQRSLRSYALLYSYREGNPASYNALLENDPALKQYLSASGSPAVKDLDAAENRLMDRLGNLEKIQNQLKPQVERYQGETKELDELLRAHEELARKVRTAVIVWARTHRNLSAGIPVPPEIDLYSMLTGAASQAAGKASKLIGL